MCWISLQITSPHFLCDWKMALWDSDNLSPFAMRLVPNIYWIYDHLRLGACHWKDRYSHSYPLPLLILPVSCCQAPTVLPRIPYWSSHYGVIWATRPSASTSPPCMKYCIDDFLLLVTTWNTTTHIPMYNHTPWSAMSGGFVQFVADALHVDCMFLEDT